MAGNLAFKAARDFETEAHSYEVEVTADDGANTTAQILTVNLTDVNDNAPVITTASPQSVAENTALVAALTSTDADTVGTIRGHVLDHGRGRCGVVRDCQRQPGVQGGQGLRDRTATATRWK